MYSLQDMTTLPDDELKYPIYNNIDSYTKYKQYNNPAFRIDFSKVTIKYIYENERLDVSDKCNLCSNNNVTFYQYTRKPDRFAVLIIPDKEYKNHTIQLNNQIKFDMHSDRNNFKQVIKDYRNIMKKFIMQNFCKIAGDQNILFRNNLNYNKELHEHQIYMIFPYKFKKSKYMNNKIHHIKNCIINSHKKKSTKIFGFDIFPNLPTVVVGIIVDYSDLDWTIFKHLYLDYKQDIIDFELSN